MSDLSWQTLQQWLPVELQLIIAEEIVFNTRALFIFDVDIDLARTPGRDSPPRKTPRLRFWPVVNPPPSDPDHASWSGTYESETSKLIRTLLDPRLDVSPFLRKKLERLGGIITVPNGTVFFNPEKHIMCIRDVNYIDTRPIPWTRRDFNINHLAFMGGSRPDMYMLYAHADFGIIRSAFPGIQNIYGVHREDPRRDPSKPIEIVCPATERHLNLSPGLVCKANGDLASLKRALYRNWSENGFDLPTLAFQRLILI